MALRAAQGTLLILTSLCGGCGAPIDPIQVGTGCPENPLRGPLAYVNEPVDQLISNFETGNAQLAVIAGRDGQWVEGSDGTEEAKIIEVSSRCAARGQWAGHFMARGFTKWGDNWTAAFRAPNPVPYDGRAYVGISFWAAFGAENPAPFPIPVGIATMDTAWNSSLCSECTDHYMTKVLPSQSWQRFMVKFDSMKQAGWGDPIVDMRRDQMVGFVVWPDHDFDLWIDDVRFEK
jgi:hypothetical protein